MIEQRIRELLAVRNLSPTQFADTIGISRPIVSHILSGRNKPSLEVVQKVIAAFPDLSLNWLLNGTGPMQAAEPLKSPETLPKRTPRPEGAPTLVAAATVPAEARASLAEGSPATPATEADAATLEAAPPQATRFPAPRIPTPIAASNEAPAGQMLVSEKRIKRIVIFYHDGTFSDFQPEG